MLLSRRKDLGISTVLAVVIIVVVLAVASVGVYFVTYYKPTSSSAGPIVLGVGEDTNGEVGPGIIKAIQLAANQINAQGGITLNGVKRNLTVVVEDTYEEQTSFTSSEVVSAFTKLVTVDHANVLLGGYTGSGYIPPIAAQYKIVYIAGSGGSINQSEISPTNQYKYVFQDQIDVAGWGTYESYALLYYALTYHAHQVAWVTEDQSFFHTHLAEAIALLSQYNITVNPQIFFPPTQTDFSSIIQQIRSSGDPVTFDGFIVDNSAPFMTQWKDTQMKTFLLGIDNPAGEPSADNASSGLYNYYIDLEGLQPVPVTNLTLPFYSAFTAAMGRAPDIYDGNYYTAVRIVAQAIQAAQTLNSTVLAATIHSGTYTGVQGIIQFNNINSVSVPKITVNPTNLNVSVAPGFVMLFSQWQPQGPNGGKLVIVFPTQFAQTSTLYPPWFPPP